MQEQPKTETADTDNVHKTPPIPVEEHTPGKHLQVRPRYIVLG